MFSIFRCWRLEAVLGDDATSPVPLIPALAAELTDKTQTSNLIRFVNKPFLLRFGGQCSGAEIIYFLLRFDLCP